MVLMQSWTVGQQVKTRWQSSDVFNLATRCINNHFLWRIALSGTLANETEA